MSEQSPKFPNSPRIRRNLSAASNGLSRGGLNRSGGDISLGGSIRNFALQAVADADDVEQTRSISGRLGYRGLSTSKATTTTPVPDGVEMPTEGTQLMPPSPGLTIDTLSVDGGGDDGGSPPLTVWIVPALSCAAAYAFYNVSIYTYDMFICIRCVQDEMHKM